MIGDHVDPHFLQKIINFLLSSHYRITLCLNHATIYIFGKEISSTFRWYVVWEETFVSEDDRGPCWPPYFFQKIIIFFLGVGYLSKIPQTSFFDQSFWKPRYRQLNNHGYQEKIPKMYQKKPQNCHHVRLKKPKFWVFLTGIKKQIRTTKFTNFNSHYRITLCLNHATIYIFGKEISSTFRWYVVWEETFVSEDDRGPCWPPYFFQKIIIFFLGVGYLSKIPQTSFFDQSFWKPRYRQLNNHGYQEK